MSKGKKEGTLDKYLMLIAKLSEEELKKKIEEWKNKDKTLDNDIQTKIAAINKDLKTPLYKWKHQYQNLTNNKGLINEEKNFIDESKAFKDVQNVVLSVVVKILKSCKSSPFRTLYLIKNRSKYDLVQTLLDHHFTHTANQPTITGGSEFFGTNSEIKKNENTDNLLKLYEIISTYLDNCINAKYKDIDAEIKNNGSGNLLYLYDFCMKTLNNPGSPDYRDMLTKCYELHNEIQKNRKLEAPQGQSKKQYKKENRKEIKEKMKKNKTDEIKQKDKEKKIRGRGFSALEQILESGKLKEKIKEFSEQSSDEVELKLKKYIKEKKDFKLEDLIDTKIFDVSYIDVETGVAKYLNQKLEPFKSFGNVLNSNNRHGIIQAQSVWGRIAKKIPDPEQPDKSLEEIDKKLRAYREKKYFDSDLSLDTIKSMAGEKGMNNFMDNFSQTINNYMNNIAFLNEKIYNYALSLKQEASSAAGPIATSRSEARTKLAGLSSKLSVFYTVLSQYRRDKSLNINIWGNNNITSQDIDDKILGLKEFSKVKKQDYMDLVSAFENLRDEYHKMLKDGKLEGIENQTLVNLRNDFIKALTKLKKS